MKFSTSEDIAAPIEAVFAALSDFPTFEQSAMRRGAEVQRLDRRTSAGPGMAWDTAFRFRGKKRRAQIEIATFTPPDGMTVTGEVGGFVIDTAVELFALSRSRTRMSVELNVRPRSFTARFLLQSARIGKTNLNRRFRLQVAKFANGLETRLARRA